MPILKKLTVLSALGSVLWIVAVAPASAADRRVEIINKTGGNIEEFYASNSGTDSWEEDILGADVLEPGQSIIIDIDDGTGACKFDFRAVFDDGSDLVKSRINVCETASYTYTE